MKQQKNNLEELNEVWKLGQLKDFIKRMLIYFDPMDLIVVGAPDDEYDSYIPQILKAILEEGITKEKLSNIIFDMLKNDVQGDVLKKKAERMAEDLIELKNS